MIFCQRKMAISIKANNVRSLEQKELFKRHGLKISYYVVGNEPLVMEFSIDRSNVFDMQLESSFDLMQNPLFSMQKRRLDDANSVYLE
jgi:hypothetical protein